MSPVKWLFESRQKALLWGGLVLSLVLIVGYISVPPFITSHWRAGVMLSLSTVCHQIAERSFHIGGVPFGVCHRCYGIYWGLLVGLSMYPLLFHNGILRNAMRTDWLVGVLLASVGMMALDWLLPIVQVGDNTMLSRVGTGLFFGVMAGWCLGKVVLKRDDLDSTSPIDIPDPNFV